MSASAIGLLRKRRGWSRLELATAAGVTESTITRAEKSTPPAVNLRSLGRIADALEVTVGALLELSTGAPGPDDDDDALELAHDRDVLFSADLARELRTSVRRLRAILKVEPWKLPERLPAIDRRDRWSRVVVERWLELHDADRRARQAAARAGGRAALSTLRAWLVPALVALGLG
jgi:transcriptional regulator with XRE-family HTH domain